MFPLIAYVGAIILMAILEHNFERLWKEADNASVQPWVIRGLLIGCMVFLIVVVLVAVFASSV